MSDTIPGIEALVRISCPECDGVLELRVEGPKHLVGELAQLSGRQGLRTAADMLRERGARAESLAGQLRELLEANRAGEVPDEILWLHGVDGADGAGRHER